MTETRTAVLAVDDTDIPGKLIVTFTLVGNTPEQITFAYEAKGYEIDPYTISYEHVHVLGGAPSAGISTPNTSLGFPELAATAEETWERATEYYLTRGVFPYLQLTSAQRAEVDSRFVKPLSRAIRFLSQDTARLRSYPDRFRGKVGLEMASVGGKLEMSDTIEISEAED